MASPPGIDARVRVVFNPSPDAVNTMIPMMILSGFVFPVESMRYDRARKNLDRHPNYILAADMASGT